LDYAVSTGNGFGDGPKEVIDKGDLSAGIKMAHRRRLSNGRMHGMVQINEWYGRPGTCMLSTLMLHGIVAVWAFAVI
jgi:hypothetical protein